MSELISPTGFTNSVGAELVSNKPDKPENKDVQTKQLYLDDGVRAALDQC